MNERSSVRHNPLADLEALGEALLEMYDTETAERCLLEALTSDKPMQTVLRFANRRIVADFDLRTASCLLSIAAQALDRAGYLWEQSEPES